MIQGLCYLFFKIISFAYGLSVSITVLFSDFMRYVYTPLFITKDKQKIITAISLLQKKPKDEITLVVEVKGNQIQEIVSKIQDYCKIIEDGVTPKTLNCYFSTSSIDMRQAQQIKSQLQSQKIHLIFDDSHNYGDKIQIDKSKVTPLIISFCSYPSICSLPACYLVGAQICFLPEILKTTTYDIYNACRNYAASQQRKGK